MSATQDLSVNCENGAGEEEINKTLLLAPSFSEDTACLGVCPVDRCLCSLQKLHLFPQSSLS